MKLKCWVIAIRYFINDSYYDFYTVFHGAIFFLIPTPFFDFQVQIMSHHSAKNKNTATKRILRGVQ